MNTPPSAEARPVGVLVRLGGVALLLATGGIHLDLYLTGYRHIATIGPLFLLQVISAFLLAAANLIVGRRVLAIAGAGFGLATLGGYVLSLWIGLFGFNEVRTTAGIVAGLVDIGIFGFLGAWTAWLAPRPPTRWASLARADTLQPVGSRAIGPLAVLAFLALLLSELASSPPTGAPIKATGTPVPSGPSVKVTIDNFAFSPANVTARPGERIVVTNRDGVAHTFTGMPGSQPMGSFDSGVINTNQTATVIAPTTPGVYNFYCSIHPFMTGKLTVST